MFGDLGGVIELLIILAHIFVNPYNEFKYEQSLDKKHFNLK